MSMWAISLADMISDWASIGVSGLVAIAVIAMIIVLLRINKRNNDSLEQREKADAARLEEEEKRLTSVINMVRDVIKEQSEPKKHTGVEELSAQQAGTYIYSTLRKIRQETQSTRVLFCMFHNGSYSLNGKMGFRKFSLINEACAEDIAPTYDRIQNLPAQMFSVGIEYLYKNRKGIVVEDIEKIKPIDSVSYFWFKDRNVKSFIVQGVFDDEEDILLGFIVSEYMFTPESGYDWKVAKVKVTRGTDKIGAVLQASEEDKALRRSYEGDNLGGFSADE